MRTSKLNEHADWLRQRFQDGTPIQRLRRELGAEKGCRVAPETMRIWVTREIKSGRINGKKRRRGRPPSANNKYFNFLPSDPATPLESVNVPALFFALLCPEPPKNVMSAALMDRHIEVWSDADLVDWAKTLGTSARKFSDLDYCLLAFLMHGPYPIPFGYGKDAINTWAQRLLADATRIKSLVQKEARAAKVFGVSGASSDEMP